MDIRPTFASVTSVPCTCHALHDAANNPDGPIRFDPRTNEFHIRYKDPSGKGEGSMVIYHCPFCGGTAPPSKRALLFATITPAEGSRLASLLAPVNTLAKALELLGKPDREQQDQVHHREEAGTPPRAEFRRTFVYEKLSSVAEVWLIEYADGQARGSLRGKYVGNSPSV